MKRSKRLQLIITLLEMSTSVTCGNIIYRIDLNLQCVFAIQAHSTNGCFYPTSLISDFDGIFNMYLSYNREANVIQLKIY